jgi:succinate dehydrogenase / fumarate reductase, cytochrome b subunit
MSKSFLVKSSIAKKYWMALTGLFLCLFLVGHLLGNLQLIMKAGEEGRRSFNEYAYFMQHNILIKVMSYVTYLSILFHAIDGILLAVQNKKARPVAYAMNNANTNSSSFARQMALLGSIILIFIATHMVNFWGKMHFGHIPLHVVTKEIMMPQETEMGVMEIPLKTDYYLTTKGDFIPKGHPLANQPGFSLITTWVDTVKNETFLHAPNDLVVGEGYKDLHSVVMAFFGQDKSQYGKELKKNELAWLAVLLYTISMAVLAFHLLHGFSSAFQSLGIRHPRYTPLITLFGKVFAVVVPTAFAIIPLYLFFK